MGGRLPPEFGSCLLRGAGREGTISLIVCISKSGVPGGSVVKKPPAMEEICMRSLGWEDSLERDVATHLSILAWKILWTEEPGGLQFMGLQRVRHD